MRFALLYVYSMKLFFVAENTSFGTLNAFWLFLWFSPVIVSFYQNNFEGSFDHSVRELEQLPQRFFCATVWDTPPSVGSIEFHFPEICPRGNLTDPTRVFCLPVKILFVRILKVCHPTFEYDISMEVVCFIEITFGLFPGGRPSDLEKLGNHGKQSWSYGLLIFNLISRQVSFKYFF